MMVSAVSSAAASLRAPAVPSTACVPPAPTTAAANARSGGGVPRGVRSGFHKGARSSSSWVSSERRISKVSSDSGVAGAACAPVLAVAAGVPSGPDERAASTPRVGAVAADAARAAMSSWATISRAQPARTRCMDSASASRSASDG
eukprot:scaffold4284_cov113-Isochrysis_galbana.AAC.6